MSHLVRIVPALQTWMVLPEAESELCSQQVQVYWLSAEYTCASGPRFIDQALNQ